MTNTFLPPIANVTSEAELKTYHEVQMMLFDRLELGSIPKLSVNKVGNVSVISIIVNH